MAKSLEQIQKQIAKLQSEADSIRKKEVGAVIARIREAISHYGLTQADLFGSKARSATPRATKSVRRGKVAGRRSAGVIRYRDEQGNAWTGHGRRPQWFIDALAAGKAAEDLAV